MSHMAEARHQGALELGKRYKSLLTVENVELFARRYGLYIASYTPTQDTWMMSDGEIYSTHAIIIDNAKELFLGGKASD